MFGRRASAIRGKRRGFLLLLVMMRADRRGVRVQILRGRNRCLVASLIGQSTGAMVRRQVNRVQTLVMMRRLDVSFRMTRREIWVLVGRYLSWRMTMTRWIYW